MIDVKDRCKDRTKLITCFAFYALFLHLIWLGSSQRCQNVVLRTLHLISIFGPPKKHGRTLTHNHTLKNYHWNLNIPGWLKYYFIFYLFIYFFKLSTRNSKNVLQFIRQCGNADSSPWYWEPLALQHTNSRTLFTVLPRPRKAQQQRLKHSTGDRQALQGFGSGTSDNTNKLPHVSLICQTALEATPYFYPLFIF